MALHRLVNIDGQRWEITDKEIIAEHSCDRCGRFIRTFTVAQVAAELLGDVPHDVLIELCDECVGAYFPGLVDIANKMLRNV